mgnify:CR=1 FL=1
MAKKGEKKLAKDYTNTLADSIIKYAEWSKDTDMDLSTMLAEAVVDKATESKVKKPTSQMVKAITQEFKTRRSDRGK